MKGSSMNRQPSLLKIILVDYLSFISVMVPLVTWAFYLYLLFSKREDVSGSVYLAIFGAITVAALICLVWRIALINSTFAEGMEVPATITRIFFYRDRGSIYFNYTFMGEQVKCRNSVMKWKKTRELESGMEIIVMVEQNHPKRAIIRDLYLQG
jgi:hypothetical protein